MEKIFEEIVAKNFSKFDKKYEHTEPGSSMKPKQKKHKENYSKEHHIQTAQPQ